ncbi:MAG: DNA (cytosine-5-)-methyltransferase [Gammaproteobacteria bacterium]|nr:MAG: DNA (cytosine-5-)-methyltransferase [Gammaproteobacteria bacterium]
MEFVDLFAGLGGFHLALSELGHNCVFASEINEKLRDLYEKNFGIRPKGDIREVPIECIPRHDILCAGFPCQPFSKAGDQLGFNCPRWGDLFDFVLKVVAHHQPTYLILENVPNIEKHDEGRTFKAILAKLRSEGYDVDRRRLSPHQFGIPQIRDRIFIVGSRNGLDRFCWPEPTNVKPDLRTILDEAPEDVRELPPHYIECLDVWQEFVKQYPSLPVRMPSFPIWSMEFGATYEYEHTTPHEMMKTKAGRARLREQRGSHGVPLADVPENKILDALPSYAKKPQKRFPRWKIRYIKQNRDLYQELKPWIDEWIPKILPFPSSLQKLEWNFKEGERDIWKHVLQFRASGIRVKCPTTAPSLIAMTTTQVPIVGETKEEKRYMTKRECARLQSLDSLKHLPASDHLAYKALGNAVNVKVVRMIAEQLLHPTVAQVHMSLFDNPAGDDGSTDRLGVATVESPTEKVVC